VKRFIWIGYVVTIMQKRENAILTRVDDHIYKRIKEIAKQSADLNASVSEIVYAILRAFFKANKPDKDLERARELVIRLRKGLL